jgi:hypothetical protein
VRAINNPSLGFIGIWSEELAEKFSCSVEEIQKKGLSAKHFPHQTLEVSFVDGSFIHLHYAFFVVSKDGQYIAVFTEHCGYFSWNSRGITITKIEEERVFPKDEDES